MYCVCVVSGLAWKCYTALCLLLVYCPLRSKQQTFVLSLLQQSKVETLATLLEEAESKIESLEHPGKFGLEAATSIATQVDHIRDFSLRTQRLSE